MEKKLDYLYYADNDYNYVKIVIESGLIFNGICHNSQNICEKYLKHIIDINDFDKDLDVFRTHSIKVLYKFFKHNIKDFICDWNKVIKADGYYFEVKYPGESSYEADEEDVKISWDAVQEVRQSVLNYLKDFKPKKVDKISNNIMDVINKLKNESEGY